MKFSLWFFGFFFSLKQVWSNFIFLLSSFRIFNLKLSQNLHDRWIIPKFCSNACYKVLKIKWLSIVESFRYVEGCNLELYFYFSITFMVTIFVVWYVYQKCLRGDIVKFSILRTLKSLWTCDFLLCPPVDDCGLFFPFLG